MIKRDNCRSQMKGASAEARQILHVKYKQLRNKINSQMRRENVARNSERIKAAADENERLWLNQSLNTFKIKCKALFLQN